MPIQINGTTGISGVDGSASAPALQGTDANTGVHFPAADTVAISTNGAQRVTVDSTGRVGIGTASPQNIFDVVGASQIAHRFTGAASGFALGQFDSSGNASVNNIANASLLLATNNTERMRIKSDGVIVFAAGAAATTLANNETAIVNDAGYGQAMRFGNTYGSGKGYCTFTTNGTVVGNITASGTTGTAYNTTSDYRLKENVVPVTDGITRLQHLKPSRFNFIADPDKTVDGFLAHEVQTVVPEAINGEKDAVDADGNPIYQGIDQSKLVPLLTAALQEAIGRIESLEAEVTALKAS